MRNSLKSIWIIISLTVLISSSVRSQNYIEPAPGYSTQIGITVSMLEDLKRRVTNSVSHLSIEETDFLLDAEANRIGTLIMHLAATEKYYQLYTFDGRYFNDDESEWEIALDLGETARSTIKDKPITYYLEIWDEVRAETLRLLKTKDDKWFSKKVVIKNSNMNNHWAWYHVMEHQANHMGQIRMIEKRASK